MPKIILIFALLLCCLGGATWLLTDQTSLTALIPSFFGLVLAATGGVAIVERLRKHAIHLAALVSLLGILGSLQRAIPGLFSAEPMRVATLSQLLMASLLLIFFAICIRSFIIARRSSKSTPPKDGDLQK